jgi:hypothetical protein
MTNAMEVLTVRPVESRRQQPAAPHVLDDRPNCFILVEGRPSSVGSCRGSDLEVGAPTKSFSNVTTDIPGRTSWKRLGNDGLLKR